MNAVCRWVSCYGWGQGVRQITSPTDLRERVGHSEFEEPIHTYVHTHSTQCVLLRRLQSICGPFMYVVTNVYYIDQVYVVCRKVSVSLIMPGKIEYIKVNLGYVYR